MGKSVVKPLARLTREQVLRMAEAEKRRRDAAEARDAKPETVGGWVLTTSQAMRLTMAEKLAAGSVEDRRRAAVMVRGVRDEISLVRDAMAVEADIADSLARAAERGESFEAETVVEGGFLTDGDGALLRVDGHLVADVVTVRRARRVDGVMSLFRSGRIDAEQKKVCDDLRGVWARSLAPVRTSSFELHSGGNVDREAPMAAAMERGFAGRLLAVINAGVGSEGAKVLMAVAGHGASVRSLASGRAFERMVVVLKDSLNIAGVLLGEYAAEQKKARSGSIDDAER